MKKLFIIFILIMVLYYAHLKNKNFTLTDYFVGKYSNYSTNSINGTDLGFCYMNNEPSPSTIGESVVCNNLELSSAIKTLNATILKKEHLSCGTVVLYAFSPLINKSVELNNSKVNLQIAIKENEIIIGWPLILGSF